MPWDRRKPIGRPTGWLRVVIAIVVAIGMTYVAWQKQQQQPQPNQPPPAAKKPPSFDRIQTPGPAPDVTFSKTLIRDQRIVDQRGHEVFRGDIDVRPTLERIRAGKSLSFPNDGSVFQNREGLLKKQPAGYYKEYVHPTPGLSGPGPQRIVRGKGGEAYYTPDHYRTFRRVDEP